MKRTLAFVLALLITVHAPWRLLGVGVEMFVVHPGAPRFNQSTARYWEAQALETRLLALGWSVRYAPHLIVGFQEAYGVTVSQEHAIVLDSDLAWDARYAVLAHEAGHTQQPYWMNASEADCFAEAVAVVLAQDGLREHARYLATRRWTCAFTLAATWPAVYHAVATLRD